MKISVIFTTYNSPEWLEKVLWGFHYQTDKNFEVIVADDGSKQETADRIEQFTRESGMAVRHLWQEDDGFQKCRILNKAIVEAQGDYLILTDGDCIPRKDFVAVHREYAEPGYYLSGGYLKLPMSVSKAITKENIKNGDCFDKTWLVSQGMKSSHKFMKLTVSECMAKLLNRLTLTKRTWNGHNASGWKSDALKVNGFDERMQYGGLDCEFGDRLINAGLKTKQIRYSAITVHLDHGRSYQSKEGWARNRKIRDTSINEKIVETPAGIRQSGYQSAS